MWGALRTLVTKASLSRITPIVSELSQGSSIHTFVRQNLNARGLLVKEAHEASRIYRPVADRVVDAKKFSTAAFGAPPLVAGGASAQSQVKWWLAGCTGWVFSMVVIGGVTRLTRSGLSMTDWKFTGEKRPVTEEEWEAEFSKYKKSPEYLKVNQGMSLEEFKFIYWLEYGHRMWGRFLGVVFAVPCAYFAARGYITKPLALRIFPLFLMGGGQGLVGWWMVKSGLEQPRNEYAVPRVSPYRLAAHLSSAFAIYTGLLWTTLSVAHPAGIPSSPQTLAAMRHALGFMVPLSALVAVTAVSGAFVAGLDAGHAYNTFPLMGGQLVPAEYWEAGLTVFENTFENTAAVQFHHRVLATSTLCSVAAVWAMTRGLALPSGTHTALHAMLGMTCCQVALGISTLLTYVPVSLGSLHQAGALTLMSITITILHTLRPAMSIPAGKAVAATAGAGIMAAGGFASTATPRAA